MTGFSLEAMSNISNSFGATCSEDRTNDSLTETCFLSIRRFGVGENVGTWQMEEIWKKLKLETVL